MASSEDKEAIQKRMDEAAHQARLEWDILYPNLDEATVQKIVDWMTPYIRPAGWKRLAKIIAGKD